MDMNTIQQLYGIAITSDGTYGTRGATALALEAEGGGQAEVPEKSDIYSQVGTLEGLATVKRFKDTCII